jgi:nucleolar MIF4G domain-containing protein 1
MILEALSIQTQLKEGILATFAKVIVILCGEMGSDIGMGFLSTVIKRLFQLFKDTEKEDNTKYALHLIQLISFLYVYRLIGPNLLYELVEYVISKQDLNEFYVEVLLKLIRTAGSQLRHDDPNSLKDIIILIQEHKSAIIANSQQSFSRFKFLLEVLDDLKHNKRRIIKDGDQSNSGISDLNIVSLDVSLKDLCDENKTVPHSVDSSLKNSVKTPKSEGSTNVHKAAMQAMNTDIRRAIFMVVMGSDDYLDACERLQKLSLTSKQLPEISRVLIYCCKNESSYNPYYTYLAKSLLRINLIRSKSLVYCLLDILKSLADKNHPDHSNYASISSLYHLGKLFGALFSEGLISPCSLKTVQFSILDHAPKLLLFMTLIISEGMLPSIRDSTFEEYWLAPMIDIHNSIPLLKEGFLYFFSKWSKPLGKIVTDSNHKKLLLKAASDMTHVLVYGSAELD